MSCNNSKSNPSTIGNSCKSKPNISASFIIFSTSSCEYILLLFKICSNNVSLPFITFLLKYEADFIYEKDGQLIVEDVKGMRKGTAYSLFQLKKRIMYEKYNIIIQEI